VDESDDPLVKAGGMKTILQSFFKNNKKSYKAFVTAKKTKKAKDSDSENEEEVLLKKKEKKIKEKKAKSLAGLKRKRSDS